jgi:pimeloyl-ACP methyl ester carboxylesterase
MSMQTNLPTSLPTPTAAGGLQLRVHDQSVYAYTGGKPFDPRLRSVVFIHGAQNDHSVWALQSRYLAHHGFAVLALDLPGHGRSGGAALLSIEAMASWLLAVLDAAGVGHASLIGHSMGALIALEACAQAGAHTGAHTDAHAGPRIGKIALLGSAFPMKVSAALLEAAKNDEPAAIEMVTKWSHSGIAQKPSCPGPGFYTPGMHRRLAQRISAINPDQVYFTDFSACNNYANGLQAAANITCPALFICADKDMMTPFKAAQGLIKVITGAQVVKITRSGHAMMAEQPDQVLAALWSFLAGG